MHKEVVGFRAVPRIYLCFAFMILCICLSDLFKVYVNDHSMNIITTLSLTVIFGLFVVYEILKCRVKYKYSIIADTLIIYKIIGREQLIQESIKIGRIEYFGKSSELKGKYRLSRCNRYSCTIINKNIYCCVYNEGGKAKKIFFQPSNQMVNKLQTLISYKKVTA